MDLAGIGSKRLICNGRGQIRSWRDHNRALQKTVQALDVSDFDWGRHQNGHGHTSFRDNDTLQLSAADAIENVEALRLELARADNSSIGHYVAHLWSPEMTIDLGTGRFPDKIDRGEPARSTLTAIKLGQQFRQAEIPVRGAPLKGEVLSENRAHAERGLVLALWPTGSIG